MELKDHECSVNGMGVNVGRETPDSTPQDITKMHKLEHNFTHEVNNRFPCNYAKKISGTSKLQFDNQRTTLPTHQLLCIFHVLPALVFSYDLSYPCNNSSAFTIILMQYKFLTLHLCRI